MFYVHWLFVMMKATITYRIAREVRTRALVIEAVLLEDVRSVQVQPSHVTTY